MALGVSLFNNSYSQGIDSQAVRSTTDKVLANAFSKSSISQAKQNIGIDLYNGQIDAMTAKQVAMSNAGLQVTLNNNLETALNFLKSKKAAEVLEKTAENNVATMDMDNDKKGSNPFYNGEFAGKKKSEKKESEYLFINVA